MKEQGTDVTNKREGVDYVNEGKGADVSITTDFKGRKADVSKQNESRFQLRMEEIRHQY